MSKLYPIYKLPQRTYGRNIPTWIKYWLYEKTFIQSLMELSEILTGSEFTLLNTVFRKFKIFELGGKIGQEQLSGKNLFNANAIGNSDIQVLDDGKIIKMPLVSSSIGFTSTLKKLSELCPTLAVGDEVYLYFIRNIENASSNCIFLEQANVRWDNGFKKVITQEMLDSTFVMYANRYASGETQQIYLSDFRIVKTQNDTYEPYCGRNTSTKSSVTNARLKM